LQIFFHGEPKMTTILNTLPALATATHPSAAATEPKKPDSAATWLKPDEPAAELQIADHSARHSIRIIRTSISEGQQPDPTVSLSAASAKGADLGGVAIDAAKSQILSQFGAGVFRQTAHDPQAILDLLR
jgi:hypothetical protein